MQSRVATLESQASQHASQIAILEAQLAAANIAVEKAETAYKLAIDACKGPIRVLLGLYFLLSGFSCSFDSDMSFAHIQHVLGFFFANPRGDAVVNE